METDDRQTDVPDDPETYAFAARMLTAPKTIPAPEAVQASDPYETDDNGQIDYEGGW